MRSKRQWVQCELQVLPGAEPWVLVRHRGGSFKVPFGAAIEAVLEGVQNGWTSTAGPRSTGGMVTISRGEYGTLKVDADQWACLTEDQRNQLLLELDDPGNKAKGSTPYR